MTRSARQPLRPGEVVLVGGGPGDPDLITVAGLHALEEADVIVHDRLGPVSVLHDLESKPELVNVGKVPRGPFTPQERINEILIEQARAGRRVVRLKGGDAFVFGRGGEEWLACAAAGVPVRVIPGVTSAVSVPALAGVPVTHRSMVQGFTVVSGHVPPDDPRSSVDWAALARANTTLVLLMAIKYLPQITERLLESGLPAQTPTAVISDGSLPGQEAFFAPLGRVAATVAAQDVVPPAIVVIGEVTALHLHSAQASDGAAPQDGGQ
ncbi:uroporphyrinogen-III C-methyltransferase [Aestuariimicrobium sp. p3-SID1156]|uniref:uroporphyrinogen-III C-methyltransferase n=1 Tax=Aestuariimicrobium sp. p3-SID1156 TaxID=2916038 RepID=UPI00223C2CA5|nr:uroporphyrinogen-III C-methyltransferase [Aestuariimicrobium sp. p3-SID1156]MCT1458616.1 uroporphyrinogen-III C-methyltransferase [Aestuariimicrobium sp. p3-SID1156]